MTTKKKTKNANENFQFNLHDKVVHKTNYFERYLIIARCIVEEEYCTYPLYFCKNHVGDVIKFGEYELELAGDSPI